MYLHLSYKKIQNNFNLVDVVLNGRMGPPDGSHEQVTG